MEYAIWGILLAILSFVIGNTQMSTKARGRIYERLDEHKRYIDEHFTRVEISEERMKRLDRIEAKVDKLLAKNGIK